MESQHIHHEHERQTGRGHEARNQAHPEQTVEETVAGLKEGERARLTQAEKAIRQSDEDVAKSGALAYEAFARKVEACVEMSELLGNNYRTYAFQKLGFRKSQAHRLVQAG